MQSEEVESPFRRRKTQMKDKLQTSQFSIDAKPIKQNETLNEQLKQIQLNFDAKQSLFSNLQKMPEQELEKLYNSGELKNVKQKWQKELEVHFEA